VDIDQSLNCGNPEQATIVRFVPAEKLPGGGTPPSWSPRCANGARDFRRLNGLLNQPNDARGSFAFDRPVWHCSLRAAPEDKTLSDDEWARIACDVMNRTGLSRYGEEDEAVRWIAVRHADDHIHIVAMLARQDGRRPSVSNERYRVRDACRAAERFYGLRSTATADRTAPRWPPTNLSTIKLRNPDLRQKYAKP
jgi:hypothetical protein